MMTKGPSDVTNEKINAETLVIKKDPHVRACLENQSLEKRI